MAPRWRFSEARRRCGGDGESLYLQRKNESEERVKWERVKSV